MKTGGKKFRMRLESNWTGAKATRYDTSRSLSPAGKLFERSRERALTSLLEYVPIGKTIEIAAGTGLITTFLLNRGFDVLATDVSEDMLDRLRQRVVGMGPDVRCEVRPENAFALSADSGSFDVAVCISLLIWLESVTQLRLAISEAARVLRPGGYFLFNYRNRWSPQNLISKGHGHTRSTIRSLLSEAELEVVATSNGSHFRLRQFRRNYGLARLMSAFDHVLNRMGSPFAWHVFVLARKQNRVTRRQ